MWSKNGGARSFSNSGCRVFPPEPPIVVTVRQNGAQRSRALRSSGGDANPCPYCQTVRRTLLGMCTTSCQVANPGYRPKLIGFKAVTDNLPHDVSSHRRLLSTERVAQGLRRRAIMPRIDVTHSNNYRDGRARDWAMA